MNLSGTYAIDVEDAGQPLQGSEEFGFAMAAGRFFHPAGTEALAIGAPGRVGFSGAVNTGTVYSARAPFPFLGGFEAGTTGAWSSAVPLASHADEYLLPSWADTSNSAMRSSPSAGIVCSSLSELFDPFKRDVSFVSHRGSARLSLPLS